MTYCRRWIREDLGLEQARAAGGPVGYEYAKRRHERWPDRPEPLARLFFLALGADVPMQEELAIIDEYLEAGSRYPEAILPVGPHKLRLAGFYLQHEVRLDRVPELANESMRYLNVRKEEAWRLMLECYRITNQPEERTALVAEMLADWSESPDPDADQSEVRGYNRRLWTCRKLAETIKLPADGLSPVAAIRASKSGCISYWS